MRVRGCILIEERGKVLVLAYDYSNGRIFAIPGGCMEQGETLAEAVIREYEEELGLKVAVDGLRYVGDAMARGDVGQTVHVVFGGRIESGTPRLNLKYTSASEVLWVEHERLNEIKLYPAINRAILDDISGGGLPRYLGNCNNRDWV